MCTSIRTEILSIAALAEPPMRILRCYREHRVVDCKKDLEFVASF